MFTKLKIKMVGSDYTARQKAKDIVKSRAKTRKYCREMNKVLGNLLNQITNSDDNVDCILSTGYNTIQMCVSAIEDMNTSASYKSATGAIENSRKKVDLIMEINEEMNQLELHNYV